MNPAERLAQAVTEIGTIDEKFVHTFPAGTILIGAFTQPPVGYLKTHGGAYSRIKYLDLFEAIGTTFGAGDGSTTFNVPDTRAYTIRGWDAGRGIDAGRTFGSYQEDAIRNITGSLSAAGAAAWQGGDGAIYLAGDKVRNPAQSSGLNSTGLIFDASRVVPTASENRVKNIALSFFIKYSGLASPHGGGGGKILLYFHTIKGIVRFILSSALSKKRGLV